MPTFSATVADGACTFEADGMDLFTVARLVTEFAHAWTVLDEPQPAPTPPPEDSKPKRKATGFQCGEHCDRVFSTERGRSKHLNHARQTHQAAHSMSDPRLAVVNGVLHEDEEAS